MPPNTSAQQNFIPHEAPFPSPRRAYGGGGLSDLLVLLSIVLLVASVALAVGVFLYGGYLRQSVASKVDQLTRAEAAFEPSLIQELTRLDDRMNAAGRILDEHVAFSAFFRMLEQTTIENIQYASLDIESSGTERPSIKMNGIAESVNTVALQADLFSKGGMVASPIFSNINRGLGGVRFDLSAKIEPAAINFGRLQTSSPAPIPSIQAPSSPAPLEGEDPFAAPSPDEEGGTDGL